MATPGHGRVWRQLSGDYDLRTEYWTSKDRDGLWDEVGDLGLEANGDRIVEQRTPMELSCDYRMPHGNGAG
jgi:hypothetical protein